MKTIAVIGGGYGDEGKGLITDWLCNRMIHRGVWVGEKPIRTPWKCAVVRFQGGAQSGHTVVTPKGERHIFSHFGSGTLLGIPTILSSKFVCNPYIFLKEHTELTKYWPVVYVDENCYLTTPYDVNFNRELERSRGEDRHGSVGVGFGETIEREEVGGVSLRYKDLYMKTTSILGKLFEISEYYAKRCKNLGINDKKIRYDNFNNLEIAVDLKNFRALTYSIREKNVPEYLVFEGGQGLGLDMKYGEFPHVTRSRTGIHHALEFCKNFNRRLDGVVYVTRSYTTRHGAGSLLGERTDGFNHIVDTTNISNEFQGKLRFAPFNLSGFIERTGKDTDSKFSGFAKYAMTCVDQISEDGWSIITDGNEDKFSKDEYINYIKGTFDIISFGPTRDDIKEN